MKNTKAQQIAKSVMLELELYIRPGVSERDIYDFSERRMKELGSESWWYHGIPALVLAGERTALSVSGRDYTPDNTAVGANDIVTVDLAPTLDGLWGDYARTFVLENGVCTTDIKTPEFKAGVQAECELHRLFMETARQGMTYEEIYILMNRAITEMGFVNLDFKGNLGHSVETDQNDRVYIEKGNLEEIGTAPLTFEPHIKAVGGRYGFKHENIYEFADGVLACV